MSSPFDFQYTRVLPVRVAETRRTVTRPVRDLTRTRPPEVMRVPAGMVTRRPTRVERLTMRSSFVDRTLPVGDILIVDATLYIILVEPVGIEPTTFCLQGRCSPN